MISSGDPIITSVSGVGRTFKVVCPICTDGLNATRFWRATQIHGRHRYCKLRVAFVHIRCSKGFFAAMPLSYAALLLSAVFWALS